MVYLPISFQDTVMKSNCLYCGKEINRSPCYVKTGRKQYCSVECVRKAQDKAKIHIKCTNCGKEIVMNPCRYKHNPNQKRFFCNSDCYNEYRIKCVEKKPNANRIRTTRSICKILQHHHNILHDDPERLSTDFMKSIIRVNEKKPINCNVGDI